MKTERVEDTSTLSPDTRDRTMWQIWIVFYIGVWFMLSAFVIGGGAKLNNLVFGFFIAVLSLWSAMIARRLSRH